MPENRRTYEGSLEAQLEQWKDDLALLRAKASRVGTDPAQYEESIAAIQHQHDTASYHLSSLRGASDGAWQSVKASTETGWMEYKAL
ncbi:hypothetical protein [Geothrix sp.]|jgi:hypothetical protein|uniref:hypothetical protein n=1 Tax=Geothrix sp. TaxID=1962974 RepID=UPI0025BF72FE|nr:hypothetical protein [Geothrix sp.]